MNDPQDTALAVLDDRARRAAATLRRAVDESIQNDDRTVHYLAGGPTTTSRRGRTWLVAAAILVVLGVVAALVATRDAGEDGANVVSGGEASYLVPGWLPDGWELYDAVQMRASDFPDAPRGTVTVYGDTSTPDPWASPHLSLLRGTNMDPSTTEDAEAISVAGRDATFEDDGSTGVLQMVLDDGDLISIAGWDLDRAAVLAAAEHVVDGPAIAPEGLPAGFTQVASGPIEMAEYSMAMGAGLGLMYAEPGAEETQIAVVQRPGDRDDAELLRLSPIGVELTEVRGQPAVAKAGYLLQWYEPSLGLVISVISDDADEATLRRVAEELRLAAPGEVDFRSNADSGGPLDEGQVVVADGEHQGETWRLVVGDIPSEGDSGTSHEVTLEFGQGSASTSADDFVLRGWLGLIATQVRGVSGTSGRLDTGVVGIVRGDAAKVVLESSVDGPIELQLYDVEGWESKAFAGFVAADIRSGEIVVYDAAGAEIGRQSFNAQGTTMPTIPGGSDDDGTTSEECHTESDGTTVCSMTATGSTTLGD